MIVSGIQESLSPLASNYHAYNSTSRQRQYNISHHSDLNNEQFTDNPNRH